MSEENVVRLCAPTLAGIKTGSLFPCPYECRETLLTEIRRYNQVLVPKGTGSEQCLMQLIERLRAYDEFPHEIGLFLSYPPEDVKGFIEHHAADFKYAGLWKVYGDEQRARDLFAKYRRCTEIYCERLHAGLSIAQLAVNVQRPNTAQKERMLPS